MGRKKSLGKRKLRRAQGLLLAVAQVSAIVSISMENLIRKEHELLVDSVAIGIKSQRKNKT